MLLNAKATLEEVVMEFLVWLWPIGSGCADAGYRFCMKQGNMHPFLLVGLGLLFSIPLYLVWLYFEGMPETVDAFAFWTATLLHIPAEMVILILTVIAHRSSTLIKAMPYTSLTPLLLMVISPLMGGGTPTILGGVGMVVLVSGLYILNVEKGQESVWKPFALLVRDRGAQCLLLAQVIVAFAVNLDKQAIFAANGPVYLLVNHAGVSMALLSVYAVCLSCGYLGVRHEVKALASDGRMKVYMSFGLLNGVTAVLHIAGLKMLPHVPYFISGKRVGAIVCAIAIAIGMHYFERIKNVTANERKYSSELDHFYWRLGGTAVICAGMLLIILRGGDI
jgi:hypothetical protein